MLLPGIITKIDEKNAYFNAEGLVSSQQYLVSFVLRSCGRWNDSFFSSKMFFFTCLTHVPFY